MQEAFHTPRGRRFEERLCGENMQAFESDVLVRKLANDSDQVHRRLAALQGVFQARGIGHVPMVNVDLIVLVQLLLRAGPD